MPAEVISLLSSPEGPPSPPTRRRARVRDSPPRRWPPASQQKLDYKEVEVSEDIPSQSGLKYTRTTSPQLQTSSKRPQSRISAATNTLIFSDDFDTTGDLDGKHEEVQEGRAPKRTRLDPSAEGQDGLRGRRYRRIVSASGLQERPAAFKPTSAGRLNSFADVIDISSSQSLSSQKNSTEMAKQPESDPFASSQPKDQNSRPKGKKPEMQFVTTTTWDDEYDPFLSSSPKQSRPSAGASHWDPISSSAPERSTGADHRPMAGARGLSRSHSEVLGFEDSDMDGDLGSSEDGLLELNAANLAKLKLKTKPAVGNSKRKSSSKPTTKRTATADGPSKEQKAAARAAERERKQEEKERAKEQRALEKVKAAALAEVNKLRTDKKVSTPEMIVELPSTLDAAVTVQAEALLDDLKVQRRFWDSPVANVIQWHRKVDRKYNDDLGCWEPTPVRIEQETHIMVVVSAPDFVNLVLGAEGSDLEAHVLSMKVHFPEHTLVYLIEGLTAWMRKNRSVRNRQFTSAVRNLSNDAAESSNAAQQLPRQRKTKLPQKYIDDDSIEDACLHLQVAYDALIHHTNAPIETAQWIVVFTQHISTIPYRRQKEQSNDASAAFCMDGGQVRTGDGPKDTYVRLLQEIARVTTPIAYGIVNEFASVGKLIRGLEDGGPLTLEEVRKSANKDGALSDRLVGQAMSRRMYKLFMGRDETSTDI